MSEVNSAPAAGVESNAAPIESGNPESNNEVQEQMPPVPQKKKFKYKADNQEFEEELDDAEITRRLSLSKTAHRKMDEAAKSRKEAEQFMQLLKTNPEAVFSNPQIMGNDKFKQIATDWLYKNVVEPEMLTPEERQRKQMEEELNKYKETEKKQKEAAEQAQMQQLESRAYQEIENTIMEAFKEPNLPVNEKTMQRMAYLMQKNFENGFEYTPKQLANAVRDQIAQELNSIIGNAEPEQILNLLGDGISNKIRKHDLAKLRGNNFQKPVQQSEPVQEVPTKRMSPREYTEYLNKKFSK